METRTTLAPLSLLAALALAPLSLLAALALAHGGCDKLRSRGEAPGASPAASAPGAGTFSLERPADGAPLPLMQRLVVTTRSAAGQTTRAARSRLRLASDRERSELETVDQDGRPVRVMRAREGRAVYVRAGDARCSGAILADDARESLPDPASLLPPVRGAAAAGEETIGGEPARKYTFDQRAVSASASVRAQGALWVAVSGAWVVRYELRATDPSGERAWEYTASRPAPTETVRPEGCGQVLEDLAAMPGATAEERSIGTLTYQTARPAAEARAFNTQTLRASGYEQRAVMLDTPAEQLVLFSHPASRRLAVLALSSAASGAAVRVQVVDPPSESAIAAAPAPPQAAPSLPPAVAALARLLPDTLGDATASDAPNGTSTTLLGMSTTMAMRNYRAGPHSLRVMLSRGDVARLSRSAIASGPTPRQVAEGARATTLAGAPALLTIEGAQAKFKCVLDSGVLVDLTLDGPGAAGADRVAAYASALDLAALRRVR